jgi:hypothetical protein
MRIIFRSMMMRAMKIMRKIIIVILKLMMTKVDAKQVPHVITFKPT